MSVEELTQSLGEVIAARIDAEGAMTLHDYMGLANAHYYAARDPLGVGGDFITAPEISQMFGEMVGLWLGDLWMRAGQPPVHYVELGPGRGTLAADALRALMTAGCRPTVHLVETSPVLRAAQARAVPGAVFHDDVTSLPTDAPLLIVANEFFDALPFRQCVRTDAGWRERLLVNDRLEWGHRFLPILGEADVTVPDAFAGARQGSVVESCPSGEAIMRQLAERIAGQGGAMLTIDYGHAGPAVGDTMQAVQAHRFADPFVEPGARDITAHVDFTALGDVALEAGAHVSPLVGQGDFLIRLGIGARSGMLAKQAPDKREKLLEAMLRLTNPAEMGTLFKVMAAVNPDWPVAEGFTG